MQSFKILLYICLLLVTQIRLDAQTYVLRKTIRGEITPKSIIATPSGTFFAQNMMYTHTITAYNDEGLLLKTISDSLVFAKPSIEEADMIYGAPVEAAHTYDSNYIWVSNYQMYGPTYQNPGGDGCPTLDTYDESYIYKVNISTLEKVGFAKVGSVPKFIAVTPNNELVLVSNWCSGDLTIIDNQSHYERCRIKIGRYPRGIVINKTSDTAYVTAMGSNFISVINLKKFQVIDSIFVGRGPRHLCLDNQTNSLYCSINNEGIIAKIDLNNNNEILKKYVGNLPRSMTYDSINDILHVVCYGKNEVLAMDNELNIITKTSTNTHPIGVTYDYQNNRVWVACYTGSIQVFDWSEIQNTLSQTVSFPVHSFLAPFNIVIGSFGLKVNAQRLVDKANAAGYNCRYFKRENNLFSVVIGTFENRGEAQSGIALVKTNFPDAWVLSQ